MGVFRALVLIFMLLGGGHIGAQTLKLVTWNIQYMGGSKSEEAIETMADLLRNADIVAIQEVTAKDPRGVQAIARLADALNRTGAKWDYRTSNPTKGTPHQSERYAYLWKSSRVKLIDRPSLAVSLQDSVRREPFIGRFSTPLGEIILINFHAVPHDQQPEREIKVVRDLAFDYGDTPVIFMADWNVVDHHTVFNPLKRIGYHFALKGQPTTLKLKCVDQHYKNHAIDNILLPPAFSIKQAGTCDFVGHCDNLTSARKISDHLPVWVEVARK
jgi:deoxyribonuclease-1-like protein